MGNLEKAAFDLAQRNNNQIGDLLKDTTSQFANSSNYTRNTFNYLSDNGKKGGCAVTFIADDAPKNDLTKLLPIMKEKGVPFGIAVVPNWIGKTITSSDFIGGVETFMNIDELRYMQENGAEILSHTYNHKNMGAASVDLIESELRQSYESLAELGFIVDGLVYPYNSFNDDSVRISKKYYKYSFTRNTSNYVDTIDNNKLNRYSLGSYYDTADKSANGYNTSSLEYYKERVDWAISHNEWLVFVLHTHTTNFTAEQQQYLRDTIDYIKSLNVDIVSPREGFARFGNIMQVTRGDGKQLKIKSNGVPNFGSYKVDSTNEHDAVDAFSKYADGMTTLIPVNSAEGSAQTPLPFAGLLETKKVSPGTDYNAQHFNPTIIYNYSSDTPLPHAVELKRYYLENKDKWSDWTPTSGTSVYPAYIDPSIFSRPITDFLSKHISYHQIFSANIQNAPKIVSGINHIGQLITHNLSATWQHQYQRYVGVSNLTAGTIDGSPKRVFASFIRHWYNNAWTEWECEQKQLILPLYADSGWHSNALTFYPKNVITSRPISYAMATAAGANSPIAQEGTLITFYSDTPNQSYQKYESVTIISSGADHVRKVFVRYWYNNAWTVWKLETQTSQTA